MMTRWAFIFAMFAGAAFAGTIDPKTPDRKHLDYGSQFECVAKLASREAGVPTSASCVVISPHWVVTAAHVVNESTDWTVYIRDSAFPLSRVIVHDDFKSGGVCDLAIGYSEREFGLRFYPALYGQENEAGKVVSICGYGIAGTFDTGHVLSDGKKRAGSNTVDYIDPRGLIVCSVGSGRSTQLEFLISPGDSGGGLFIDGELAGINSVVMAVGRSPMSRWGDESGHTRISRHREWILERIK